MPLDNDSLALIIADCVKAATAPLIARIAVLEARQPIVGRDGFNGKDGAAGAGIGSLLMSADGHLVAHLTDGRSLDVGLLPVKEGPAGRDADMAQIEALKAEIVALRKTTPAVEVAALVKAAVDASVDDAMARLPIPKDGASVSLSDVAPMITAEVEKAVAVIPRPKDGLSVTVADVAPLIVTEVEKAVAELPKAKDGAAGQSITVADVEPVIVAHVDQILAAWPKPKDGSSVTVADVAPLIHEEVTKSIQAIPIPTNGRDGLNGKDADLADVRRFVVEEVAKIPIPTNGLNGKDGIGLAGALLTREGHLALTLSDGTVRELGPVVGKDGANGLNGKDVDLADVRRQLLEEVAKIPHPKDGINGKDGANGRDGFGFDDLTLEADGDGYALVFVKGDQRKAFRLPLLEYKGIWRAGLAHEKGQLVTWNGALWIARQSTTERPGDGKTAWQLAVKSGSEGKPGPEGKPGRDGRDLTSLGPDGSKWGK